MILLLLCIKLKQWRRIKGEREEEAGDGKREGKWPVRLTRNRGQNACVWSVWECIQIWERTLTAGGPLLIQSNVGHPNVSRAGNSWYFWKTALGMGYKT